MDKFWKEIKMDCWLITIDKESIRMFTFTFFDKRNICIKETCLR